MSLEPGGLINQRDEKTFMFFMRRVFVKRDKNESILGIIRHCIFNATVIITLNYTG